MRHGATIVPVINLGTEDMAEVYHDPATTIQAHCLGSTYLPGSHTSPLICPLVQIVYDLPIGWLPIPFLFGSDRTVPIIKPPKLSKLQRVYFAIGQVGG